MLSKFLENMSLDALDTYVSSIYKYIIYRYKYIYIQWKIWIFRKMVHSMFLTSHKAGVAMVFRHVDRAVATQPWRSKKSTKRFIHQIDFEILIRYQKMFNDLFDF